VDTKSYLAQREIEPINEINVEVIKTILTQPSKIITLTEDAMQHVEKSLRTNIIIHM
jgi:hypothetical protein